MAEKQKKKKNNADSRRREAVSKTESSLPTGSGKIRVRVCGQKRGLQLYENVSFIRIRSTRYNLLIMEDYLPVLGQIDGSVFLRTESEEVEYKEILGYFMHKNNEFSLMLEEDGSD